jgi:hypothetical protein
LGLTTTSGTPSQAPSSHSSSASARATWGRSTLGFAERAADQEPPGRPVGLEVDAGDEPVTEQEGQHVVPVDPLRLGHVDLDAVAEAEQRLGPRPVPDHRVERGQQGPRRDRPRDPGAGQDVAGLALEAADPDLLELAPRDQRREGRSGVGDPQPVVVGELGERRDPVRPGGSQQQPLPRHLDGGDLGLAGVRRDDPLGEVVDRHEARGAVVDGEVATDREVVEDGLALGVAPPRPAALAGVGEVAHGGRTVRGDLLEDRLDVPRVLLDDALQPRPLQRRGPPVVEQRPHVDRGAGLDVDPPLVQLARAPQPRVAGGPVVRADAGPERQLVRPREHVDRVELHDVDGVGDAAEVAHVAPRAGRWARPVEPLRRERERRAVAERATSLTAPGG